MAARKKEKKNIKFADASQPMLFDKHNYLWLGIGIIMVVVGFTAMYMENEVNGFISLYISPIIILGGYGVVLYAIMSKSKLTEPSESA
ncbi:MAG: DUF3098 domain-containing protein [Bacteroidota bacterium]